MRDNGYSKIQPTKEAEEEWNTHVNEAGKAGLFAETESWYFGNNIPGKPKEALNYMVRRIVSQLCWSDVANEFAAGGNANVQAEVSRERGKRLCWVHGGVTGAGCLLRMSNELMRSELRDRVSQALRPE